MRAALASRPGPEARTRDDGPLNPHTIDGGGRRAVVGTKRWGRCLMVDRNLPPPFPSMVPHPGGLNADSGGRVVGCGRGAGHQLFAMLQADGFVYDDRAPEREYVLARPVTAHAALRVHTAVHDRGYTQQVAVPPPSVVPLSQRRRHYPNPDTQVFRLLRYAFLGVAARFDPKKQRVKRWGHSAGFPITRQSCRPVRAHRSKVFGPEPKGAFGRVRPQVRRHNPGGFRVTAIYTKGNPGVAGPRHPFFSKTVPCA